MARFSDERIRAILAKPTDIRVVTYPGQPDIRIGVRCLNDVELDGCRIEAQRKIRDIAKLRGWDATETAALDPTLMERFVEREIVLRAFYDPDTIHAEKPIPFFSSEQDLGRLGADGVTLLMDVYLENAEWQNPHVTLSEDDEKELVEKLGKGQSADVLLTGFGPSTLRRLLISLVSRLATYHSGK